MALEDSQNHRIDIAEQQSLDGSESSYFTDADDGSCHSHFYSAPFDNYVSSYVFDEEPAPGQESPRASSASDCSIKVVEIEGGGIKIVGCHKKERDCRICHLGLETNAEEAIHLGCACKDDLAAAHRHCAETWFQIKGNKTCEICQSIARNVSGTSDVELVPQAVETAGTGTAETVATAAGTQSFWRGHRLLNFLLACMVFAFVISWLLHFNVTS